MNKLIKVFQDTRDSVPQKFKTRRIIYTFILTAVCLDNLNVSGSLSTVFSITEHFHSSTTITSWVFSSYALTIGAFIIISGKLADVLGSHIIFLTGVFLTGLFALVSALIEKSIIALIVIRAFQGIFASALIPSAFAVTSSYFKGDELENACKGLSIALTFTMGIGMILGGAFSESSIGYKGLYYFTFAISFFCFLVLLFIIEPIKQTKEHESLHAKNLDYGGCCFLVIGLLLIILGLTEGGHDWNQPVAYVPLIVGFVVVCVVVVFEMIYIQRYKDIFNNSKTIINVDNEGETKNDSVKVSQTSEQIEESKDWRVNLELLFPVECLKIPNFLIYLLCTFLVYIVMITTMSNLLQYYLYVENESPILASVKAFPLTCGLVLNVSLIYDDKRTYRIGMKKVLLGSPFVCVFTSVWMSRLDFRTRLSYWKFEFFSQIIMGLGINTYFMVYWNAILSGTPLHLQGVISGILQTSGQIGVCIGNAIIASISGEIVKGTTLEERISLHVKLRNNFYVPIASAAIMFILILFVKNQTKKEEVNNNKE